MARRKLSIQQRRRIRDRQSARLILPGDTDSGNNEINAGIDQRGQVVAHFGRQADIVPLPTAGAGAIPRRCFVRPNLKALVTGDEVIWRDAIPTGVIEAVIERRSILSRPDSKGNLRPVAANIDRIAVVVAGVPPPHPNLIDRYLVAAHHQGIRAFLILAKTDLAQEMRPANDLLSIYVDLGYDLLRVSARTTSGLDKLGQFLAPFTSVLVGQSGVGKSSLINALCPEAQTAVRSLSEAAEKGRHTTTAASLFRLPGGGQLIDSPGIREFGLWHLDYRRVAEGFIEFSPLLGKCRFRDCHHRDETGCAIIAAVKDRRIRLERWQSYLQIVQSLETR